jgi:streptogramin lyase
VRGLLAVVFVALAVACSADAAPPKVTLAAGPHPRAGEAWNVTLRAKSGLRIVLVARNGATSVRANATGRAGRYRARLTFPFAGPWRLEARAAKTVSRVATVTVAPAAPVASVLPGATATRVCATDRIPVPQYALSFGLDALWVACRAQHRLLRVDPATGEVRGLVPTGFTEPYAIAAGEGAVWAVERGSSVHRFPPARGASTPFTVGESAYLWTAAGSVWVADDVSSELVRWDPAARRVVAEISTGSGTSALVVSGSRGWFLDHRDATLQALDVEANTARVLARLPGDAPERLVVAFGSLWVTGRGTDLLRVDPTTGAMLATIDVGAGAIDLVASAESIWVFAPTGADDLRGWPQLERLLRVDPASNAIVETIRPTARVMVTGVANVGGTAWLSDVMEGRLYRLPR